MAFALTKEFIEKLVNQPITDFEVSPGSKVGDNVASDLKSIKVWTAPGDIITLIHKTFPGNDPVSKQFIIEGQTFRIENEFYSKLVPLIEDLIKSRNIPSYRIPLAKFYAGFNDDENDYVTLEDLRPAGYIMPDKYLGLTQAEATLILKELGRFHAFTYFLIKYEGEKIFEQNPLWNVNVFDNPEKQAEFRMMLVGIVAYIVENVSKRDPALGAKLATKLAESEALEAMSRKMYSTDTLHFPVIIHGDIWMNNTLIKYDDDKRTNPVDVKFIDFQRIRRGNIFEDLQYFIWTSTTPAFRKVHLYQCLDAYYDSFRGTLGEIKCPLPINFTRGNFVDSFNECILGAYMFMGFALPLQLGENPRMPFPGGEEVQEGNGNEGEPPQLPPNFNINDIPVEMRVQGFVGNLKKLLESSPKALDRLQELSEELEALKIL